MQFTSLDFLLFLAFVFAVFWITPVKYARLKVSVLLIASYTFYSIWDYRFLTLIILSTLTDFIAGIQIGKQADKSKKKVWLFLSLFVNLGALIYFKYANFFIESFIGAFQYFNIHLNRTTLQVILPIGISFYTFQTLSYTLDIYHQRTKPTKHLLEFATFVAFFPQLIAGPIERSKDLLPQFFSFKKFNSKKARIGLFLVLYGFFKKVVIADNIALLIDPLYQSPDNLNVWQSLAALFGFGFQVYADFSGYSDIAIGIAALLGFKLSTNFKTPFFSTSIKEFWTRWHITLYSWFRDYVYVPLGGGRNGSMKFRINIMIVFFLSGLWHGAGWNYILYGVFQGVYYLVEKKVKWTNVKWLSILITGTLITLSWAVFRAESLEKTALILEGLTNWEIIQLNLPIWIAIASVILLLFIDWRIRFKENFGVWLESMEKITKLIILYLLIFWTLLFGSFDSGQQFIYFQF